MFKRSPAAQVHRLTQRAVRQLPKSLRATHLEIWTNELASLPSPEAQLEFAQGLKEAASGIRREADPEGAFVGDIMRWTFLTSCALILLAGLSPAPDTLRLLALTLANGIGVLVFSHLTTKSLLIFPEVRHHTWRRVSMVLLGLFCALCTLGWSLGWAVVHPSTSLLLLVACLVGVQTARVYHVPRPPLPLNPQDEAP